MMGLVSVPRQTCRRKLFILNCSNMDPPPPCNKPSDSGTRCLHKQTVVSCCGQTYCTKDDDAGGSDVKKAVSFLHLFNI